jgi:rsbT co-antagonist protein RsbR
LLDQWMTELKANGVRRDDLMSERDLRNEAKELIALLQQGVGAGGTGDVRGEPWSGLRGFLGQLSLSRARQGFSSVQTATFVLALKRSLLRRIQAQNKGDVQSVADEMWQINEFVDQLALLTMEHFQKGREEVILRQQEEMLELSTPVVKLWEGVLALPLVGTLDSARTQVVMESLLQKIVDTGAEIAIIDITGVPTVDTVVAQHLLKTVTAARLMGADCIISGIRPQIAQTIVHLGVDLQGVGTKASLADAFMLALKRSGYAISRARA